LEHTQKHALSFFPLASSLPLVYLSILQRAPWS
jgi:hypothetical protein